MPNDENNTPCPIACGECCRYWRDVDELTTKFPNQSYWQSCPNHDETKGCTLPRNERPDVCNEYLCEKANAVAFPDAYTTQMMKEILERVLQTQHGIEGSGPRSEGALQETKGHGGNLR
jgi:hypothetical protein